MLLGLFLLLSCNIGCCVAVSPLKALKALEVLRVLYRIHSSSQFFKSAHTPIFPEATSIMYKYDYPSQRIGAIDVDNPDVMAIYQGQLQQYLRIARSYLDHRPLATMRPSNIYAGTAPKQKEKKRRLPVGRPTGQNDVEGRGRER